MAVTEHAHITLEMHETRVQMVMRGPPTRRGEAAEEDSCPVAVGLHPLRLTQLMRATDLEM